MLEEKNHKSLFLKIEPLLFILAVCASLIPLFTRKFFPFMDAPAHIYNAGVLRQLIVEKSSFLAGYFEVNKVLVPNWFSETIMFPLLGFMRPDMAEKTYLVFYFAGLPLAMRYCIKCIAPQQKSIAFLGIPLAYNTLSMFSFYNFSSALIFLLLITGFFYKYIAHGSPRFLHYLILFILFVLLYFSHLVVFIVAILYVGLIYCEAQHAKNGFQIKKWFTLRAVYTALSILPSFLLLCVYSLKKHAGASAYEFLDGKTLLDFFLDGRPYLALSSRENEASAILGWSVLASLILCLYLHFSGQVKVLPGNKFFPLAGLTILLLAYALLPDSDGIGGYISLRLCIIFYLMAIVYIATVRLKTRFIVIVVIISLAAHAFRLNEYGDAIQNRNRQVSAIREQAEYIEPNSFVFGYRWDADWLSHHFLNYVCLGKPGVINLQDYECEVAYFPLCWKDLEKMKNLGYKLEAFSDLGKVKTELNNRPIYLWVYGDVASFTAGDDSNLKKNLEKNCILLNSNPVASLYRLK